MLRVKVLKVVFLLVCIASLVSCAPPRKYKDTDMEETTFFELSADDESADGDFTCNGTNILHQVQGSGGAGDFQACKNTTSPNVVKIKNLNALPSAWSDGNLCFFPVYQDPSTGMIAIAAAQKCASISQSSSVTLDMGAQNFNLLYVSGATDSNAMYQCLIGMGTCPLHSVGSL